MLKIFILKKKASLRALFLSLIYNRPHSTFPQKELRLFLIYDRSVLLKVQLVGI